MAAPHVTGIVGLMLSMNHDLTPAQVKQYLVATARPDGVTCPVSGQCGAGMVDANRAVRAAIYGLTAQLALSPGWFSFSAQAVGTVSPVRELSVRNEGPVQLAATFTIPSEFELTCGSAIDCACESATTCTVAVGGGEQRILALRFRPLAGGSISQSLTITSNDPDDPFVALPLTGVGAVGAITLVTPVKGELQLGMGAYSAPVTIRNTGNAPVQLTGWRIDPAPNAAAFAISAPTAPVPFSLAPNATFSWTVSCTPIWRSGTQSVGFLIDSNLKVGAQLLDVSCAAMR
jgi:Subtilase family